MQRKGWVSAFLAVFRVQKLRADLPFRVPVVYLFNGIVHYSQQKIHDFTHFFPGRRKINELGRRMREKSVRMLGYIIKILIRGNLYDINIEGYFAFLLRMFATRAKNSYISFMRHAFFTIRFVSMINASPLIDSE